MKATTRAVAGRAPARRTRRPPTGSRWLASSSRTSASSCLIVAASPVVIPGRRPASMSACVHQPRNVSGLTPTRGPIRSTAAFNDSPGSCSQASATSRFGDKPLRPLTQLVRVLPRCWHRSTLRGFGASSKPGAVHRRTRAPVELQPAARLGDPRLEHPPLSRTQRPLGGGGLPTGRARRPQIGDAQPAQSAPPTIRTGENSRPPPGVFVAAYGSISWPPTKV